MGSAARGAKAGGDLRARELAAIHTGRRKLGWDDETYRDVLAQLAGGKRSAKDLTTEERRRVLDRMRDLGFAPVAGKPAGRTRRKPAAEPAGQWDLARELWAQLGEVADLKDPSEAGLRRFLERQTKKSRPEWCSPQELNKVVEGLKAWLARERAKGDA